MKAVFIAINIRVEKKFILALAASYFLQRGFFPVLCTTKHKIIAISKISKIMIIEQDSILTGYAYMGTKLKSYHLFFQLLNLFSEELILRKDQVSKLSVKLFQ